MDRFQLDREVVEMAVVIVLLHTLKDGMQAAENLLFVIPTARGGRTDDCSRGRIRELKQ